MRSAIREEVASIAPFDRLERAHREDALAWIDSGVELCRVQKPATPPKHLVSYFVLVDDGHVLLVDHRNAQLWLPSGGHVEPGEHPRATVARELREELGLELADDPGAPLMLTSTETVGTTAGHTDVSLWYVIDADRRVSLGFDAGEFQSVRWFQFAEAPVSRSDPHLARFLGKLALTSRSTRPRANARGWLTAALGGQVNGSQDTIVRRQRSRNAKKEAMSTRPPLMDKSAFDLTENEFEYLLRDLCVDLGFCISGPASQSLWDSKPTTVDNFIEGLFVAEGLLNSAKGNLRSTVKLHVQNFIAARRAL